MNIRGETHIDYFNIICEKCGGHTKNEYLGWDPSVPHFKVICEKCGTEDTYKFQGPMWKGLPSKPSG